MASAIDLLIAQPKPLDVGGFDRGFQAAQGRKAMRLENLMGEEKLAAAQFKNERAPIEAEQSDMAFEMEVQEYIRKQVASENAAERQRNIEQSRVVAELGPQGALQFAQANPGLFDPDDLEILQTNPKTAELIAKGYLLMANETPKPMSDIGKANMDVKRGFATQQQVDQKFGGTQDRWEPVYDAQGNPVAQRNTRTGKIESDPRATGKTPEKPPAGYRFRDDGSLEAIPGGPAAEKIENRQRGLERAEANAKRIIGDVDTAIKQTEDFFASGFGSGVAGMIRGSAATNLKSTLETIKANLGFEELQAMREASPTGGALGQVAVQELVALQATVGNLDPAQSDAQLRANLRKVKMHYENWLDTVRQAQGKEGAQGDTDALLKKYGIQ